MALRAKNRESFPRRRATSCPASARCRRMRALPRRDATDTWRGAPSSHPPSQQHRHRRLRSRARDGDGGNSRPSRHPRLICISSPMSMWPHLDEALERLAGHITVCRHLRRSLHPPMRPWRSMSAKALVRLAACGSRGGAKHFAPRLSTMPKGVASCVIDPANIVQFGGMGRGLLFALVRRSGFAS